MVKSCVVNRQSDEISPENRGLAMSTGLLGFSEMIKCLLGHLSLNFKTIWLVWS